MNYSFLLNVKFFSDWAFKVIDCEDFLENTLRYYLMTHPKIGKSDISSEIVAKWMIGLNKAMYVSIIGLLNLKIKISKKHIKFYHI